MEVFICIKEIRVVHKQMKLQLVAAITNIIYINKKKKGPRTDPCGTPDNNIFLLDIFLGPISVICLRLTRYDANQTFIIPRIL